MNVREPHVQCDDCILENGLQANIIILMQQEKWRKKNVKRKETGCISNVRRVARKGLSTGIGNTSRKAFVIQNIETESDWLQGNSECRWESDIFSWPIFPNKTKTATIDSGKRMRTIIACVWSISSWPIWNNEKIKSFRIYLHLNAAVGDVGGHTTVIGVIKWCPLVTQPQAWFLCDSSSHSASRIGNITNFSLLLLFLVLFLLGFRYSYRFWRERKERKMRIKNAKKNGQKY